MTYNSDNIFTKISFDLHFNTLIYNHNLLLYILNKRYDVICLLQIFFIFMMNQSKALVVRHKRYWICMKTLKISNKNTSTFSM